MPNFARLPDDDLDAWEAVQAARAHVEALRRLVAARKAGAASLAAAEYALHGALERTRKLDVEPDEPETAA